MRLGSLKSAICFAAAVAGTTPLLGYAAASDVAFRCDAPRGFRVAFGNVHDLRGQPVVSSSQGIRWDQDSFTNTRPMFVWRKSEPLKLLVSWGDTLPDSLVGSIKPEIKFRDASVIQHNENIIQAIERRCGPRSCTVSLFAVFPKLRFVTLAESSQGGFLHPKDSEGVTKLFAAQCETTY